MKFSSFLYPLRCPICDEPADLLKPRICPDCAARIACSTEPRCVICGKAIASGSAQYCPDCSRSPHTFVQGRGAWLYDGAVKESVHRFKFENRRQYAPFYAQEMMHCMGKWLMSRHADALIPIPMTKKKLRARGYNQAALIARTLSAYMNVPVREDVLLRREGFRQQKELSRKMRRLNLQQAFYVQDLPDLPQTVIIIDDIYTTGSTMDAASFILSKAGVRTVYAAYLCVGES